VCVRALHQVLSVVAMFMLLLLAITSATGSLSSLTADFGWLALCTVAITALAYAALHASFRGKYVSVRLCYSVCVCWLLTHAGCLHAQTSILLCCCFGLEGLLLHLLNSLNTLRSVHVARSVAMVHTGVLLLCFAFGFVWYRAVAKVCATV
jgi:hypothetical protein